MNRQMRESEKTRPKKTVALCWLGCVARVETLCECAWIRRGVVTTKGERRNKKLLDHCLARIIGQQDSSKQARTPRQDQVALSGRLS
jgi:hypothetical protein